MRQAPITGGMRRWVLAVPILAVAACLAGDKSELLGPNFAISDALHSGGTPGFFFLPPMVSQPAVTGTFDGDIAAVDPAVVICEVTTAACNTVTALRLFTPTTSPAITIEGDKYKVSWDTRAGSFLAGHTYRVQVLAGTGVGRRTLGFGDILLTTEPGKAKNLADGETIVLADGRTLAIQFRIERGVVPRSVLACDVDRVTRLINGLLPVDTRRGAAHASFAAIRSSMNSGTSKAAVSAMFALLKQTLGYFADGTLLDPTAPLGLSTGQATGEFGSQLYACVGLTDEAPTKLGKALETGGVAEVVEPSEDETKVVITDDGLAAASFPPGALDQTVLVTIIPDPDGELPFPSTLDQYQPFYDFSTFPEVPQFGEFVTVGICIDSDIVPAGRYDFLQLAHPDPATGRTTIEILTKVAAPPGVCGEGFGLVPPSPATGWRERFARLVLPEPAHATAVLLGGLGGKTTSFSAFRAVDPHSRLEFTVQPSDAAADATITPAVEVTVFSDDDLVIRSFTGSVALSLNAEATLSGTLTQPVIDGVATFADLSIADVGTGYTLTATATDEPDPPPTDATSEEFDITATCATVSQIPTDQCEALVALYNATDGANWTNNANWLRTNEPCSWYGVNCVDGVLTELFLGGNQLTGTIPADLGNLANLQSLYLFDNQLGGPIPAALGNLASLHDLVANHNQLSGGIPAELGSLTNLRFLFLNSNQLSGAIPPALGSLESLEVLALNENQLTGPIPATLGDLGSLQQLRLQLNQLSGQVPLAVALLGGQLGLVPCSFRPGNPGLFMPDTPDYRAADLDLDGIICGVGFTPLAFSSVSARSDHTCGVTATDSTAYCWGSNSYGRLGNGTTTSALIPVPVSGGLTFLAVSTGGEHTCGATAGGAAAYCWGHNSYGQLGDGTTTDAATPVPVSGGLSFSAVSAGAGHACGITTSTGAAYCWGLNSTGQLGNGSTTDASAPVPVSGGLTFVTVSAGDFHTCGVTSSGLAYCWGHNGFGQLGNGSTTDASAPVLVSGGLTFAAASAGNAHTCGVTTTGAVCWGSNSFGQLGDGTTTSAVTPVAVSGAFVAVSVGIVANTCGVTTSGAAYCWGYNLYGQLGNGTTTNAVTPVPVSGGLTFAAMSAGAIHSCGVTTGGAAYCWGYNFSGQLGNGTTINATTPIPVGP